MSSPHQLFNSFCNENESYHKLVFLLINSKLNEETFANNKNLLILDQPLNINEFSHINTSDDLEEFSKIEMSLAIHKLLEERTRILKFYDSLNWECKRLKNENINLLREFFELVPDKTKNSGLNAILLKFILNSEIGQKHIQKLENQLGDIQILCKEKDLALENLQLENKKLREKVIKSRVSLKNYLINMPIPYNDDETLAFGDSNSNTKLNKSGENPDLCMSGSFEKSSFFDHPPINKCQEWDKTSIASNMQVAGSNKKIPSVIGSFTNIDYGSNSKTQANCIPKHGNMLPQKQNGLIHSKNLSASTQSIPKLVLIKDNDKKKMDEKNNKNDRFEINKGNSEEKKELHKVSSSRFKLEVNNKGKDRTATVSGYLNVPPKNIKPGNATERKEPGKK